MIAATVIGALGSLDVGNLTALAPLGGSILLAIYLLIKAGPMWSQSLLNSARDEARGLSAALTECRDGRTLAEGEKRTANERAERYRIQLIRAGITPFDEVSDL